MELEKLDDPKSLAPLLSNLSP